MKEKHVSKPVTKRFLLVYLPDDGEVHVRTLNRIYQALYQSFPYPPPTYRYKKSGQYPGEEYVPFVLHGDGEHARAEAVIERREFSAVTRFSLKVK